MTAVYSIRPDVAYREVAGEIFLVSDDRAFHHVHLPTAVDTVVALREGPKTEDTLVSLLTMRFDVDERTAREDLSVFLKLLVERNVARVVR